MTDRPAPPRRLIDLPGLDSLEMKALMKPRHADPDSRDEFPEIAEAARAAFGLTPDEAEAVALPADWDGIQHLDGFDLVEAFEAEGWDITDAKRKPLRMMPHWALPLALAMRGVAGDLPFQPEPGPDDRGDDWGSKMAADAKRFSKG